MELILSILNKNIQLKSWIVLVFFTSIILFVSKSCSDYKRNIEQKAKLEVRLQELSKKQAEIQLIESNSLKQKDSILYYKRKIQNAVFSEKQIDKLSDKEKEKILKSKYPELYE